MSRRASVVVVSGSRTRSDELDETVWRALDELDPDVVVHGGQRGADEYAERWAMTRGKQPVSFRIPQARWESMGPSAGPTRNGLMLSRFGDGVLLAFPRGGPGTAHCMAAARRKGMRVIER